MALFKVLFSILLFSLAYSAPVEVNTGTPSEGHDPVATISEIDKDVKQSTEPDVLISTRRTPISEHSDTVENDESESSKPSVFVPTSVVKEETISPSTELPLIRESDPTLDPKEIFQKPDGVKEQHPLNKNTDEQGSNPEAESPKTDAKEKDDVKPLPDEPVNPSAQQPGAPFVDDRIPIVDPNPFSKDTSDIPVEPDVPPEIADRDPPEGTYEERPLGQTSQPFREEGANEGSHIYPEPPIEAETTNQEKVVYPPSVLPSEDDVAKQTAPESAQQGFTEIQDETIDPDRLNSKLPQEPIGSEFPQEPISNEPPQEPIGNERLQEPIGNDRSQEPIGNDGSQEPIGNERPEEPIGNERLQEPIGNDGSQEPIGNERPEEPIGNESSQEPIGNERPEEPIRNESSQEPIGNERPQEPIGNERQQERPQGPIGNERPQELTGSELPQEPTRYGPPQESTGSEFPQKPLGSERPQEEGQESIGAAQPEDVGAPFETYDDPTVESEDDPRLPSPDQSDMPDQEEDINPDPPFPVNMDGPEEMVGDPVELPMREEANPPAVLVRDDLVPPVVSVIQPEQQAPPYLNREDGPLTGGETPEEEVSNPNNAGMLSFDNRPEESGPMNIL